MTTTFRTLAGAPAAQPGTMDVGGMEDGIGPGAEDKVGFVGHGGEELHVAAFEEILGHRIVAGKRRIADHLAAARHILDVDVTGVRLGALLSLRHCFVVLDQREDTVAVDVDATGRQGDDIGLG